MRTETSGPGARWRAVLVPLLVALLAGCASTPAREPQRTYDRIQEEQLYPLTRAVFRSASFQTDPCHASRICLETSWKDYDGEKRGAVTWRERRMYTARYVRDPVDDRYMLFLDLRAQERPPGGADWSDKPIVPGQDAEYVRVLQEIDRAVKQLGGVQY